MEKDNYQWLSNDEVFCTVFKNDETAMRVLQAIFPEVKMSEVLLNTAGCEQDKVNGPLAQVVVLDEDEKKHFYSLRIAKERDNLGLLGRFCTSKMDMTMFRLIGDDYFDEDCGAVILCGINPFGNKNLQSVYQFCSVEDTDSVLPGQCPVIIINGKGKEEGESSDMKSLTHVICGDYSLDEPLAIFLKGKIIEANQKLNLVR
ncbi:hypothetical protein lacNasYZ03_00400 [Lactobacillus nasalidis]|uniref:Uncharacterized protein n=1 Tax=Lactobacillus nasalidis TaxID=2797258 RepID=A0ABQ3W285_9LACO|nr:hypothetical protein [Lactobacillus nasalidis]GHV98526.1 hypothetical protein lacNasYZ01_17080 [Lactobacillus nasalidis]GHW00021.1 hypothetical protein lacNasYZ02_14500 [Lactobacillus nasalidis]GHW00353.1 hypothetical protein lacNasYZ03_00400 [Lactobacillus nasalidis]